MACLWYKTVPWRHSELNKRRTYPGNIEDLLEVIRPYIGLSSVKKSRWPHSLNPLFR